MLPPIGSVSTLPAHGRAGVVVDARPLGDAEGGRQLVALKIKAETDGGDNGKVNIGAADHSSQTPNFDRAGGGSSHAAQTASASAPFMAAKLPDQLNAAERADLAKLQQRDQQVRQEEKAHAAVAGDLAGPINYVYQRGPDGRQYAAGGSVSVQASMVSGDPREAQRLSGRMAAAANAATSPSAQDLATARLAYDFGSRLAGSVTELRKNTGLDLTL